MNKEYAIATLVCSKKGFEEKATVVLIETSDPDYWKLYIRGIEFGKEFDLKLDLIKKSKLTLNGLYNWINDRINHLIKNKISKENNNHIKVDRHISEDKINKLQET